MIRNFTQKLLLAIIGVVFVFQSNAKKNGTWQDYLSYKNATKIAITQDKVFCVTEGGLFYYGLDDNSINKITSANGLSDFGIKTIAWNEEKKVLVIAYTNSNVDLIIGSGVFNLSDIKRKQISGDKTINNITFYDNLAYLSCGFGIVVLDLNRKEVKDTYLIGAGGSSITVYDVKVFNDSIYAATASGIMKAYKNDINLLDYNSWTKIQNIPQPNGIFNHLEVFNGKLIANSTIEGSWFDDKMYVFDGYNWSSYLTQIKYAYDIQENGNYISIASREILFVVDKNNSVVAQLDNYKFKNQEIKPINPRSVGVDVYGTIWIADYYNSLIKISAENFEEIKINGPVENVVFSMTHAGSELWVTPGNKSGWQIPWFQYLKNDEWYSFTKNNYPELNGFFNIIAITFNPSNKDHIFVASWGGGLLEYKNNAFVNRYTNQNSPLETALPTQPNEPYVRIGGLAFDSGGNLWITNSEVAKNLVKLTPTGTWETFVLPEVANSRNIGQIINTRNDDKWIVVPRGHDVYVVDKTGNKTKHLPVTAYFNNGTYEEFNRMNDVYSIAEDERGDIWIGTSKGVAVFSNPSRIWNTETYYATQPSLDLNNGLFNPLLKTETVTAIVVDGANRKWLGTDNSGVYLVSASGDKEILHFTNENSPLLSNKITSIAINQKTGEVFFGTDRGLISYQGDATEGNDIYENVYVYPNPVRETYAGNITITGLVAETDVKITDINGNLVHHTTSLGGQAVWDGKNLNGNRVRTGVYLVLCNNKDGSKTHITKLLFIN